MRHITSRALAVTIVLFSAGGAPACFVSPEDTWIMMSPALERTVSHVLVGRLMNLRPDEESAGRFIAEVLVSQAEKGRGVNPGETVRVRFTSPVALQQLTVAQDRDGHGGGQIIPVPGERIRLYTQLNNDTGFVADYPNCFFGLDRRMPATSSPRVDPRSADPIVVTTLGIAAGALGLALMLKLRGRSACRGVAVVELSPPDVEIVRADEDESPRRRGAAVRLDREPLETHRNHRVLLEEVGA